jgi:hypothetical protein
MESSLASDKEVEGSSLIVTLLCVLYLALLANRFASILTALFCMSSKVSEFLSLNWYDISALNPSLNLINSKPCEGLMLVEMAL